ncbi:unnamed protein product [Microthlaspi erraticum]|uniref:Uncharacterized protein n=1 Tax=Microthlaspi erraticum TaxID=1685480 RepID=A0A6D2I109_9BRAS|nr:unnamed protein product [Microthlaspi erraticum]
MRKQAKRSYARTTARSIPYNRMGFDRARTGGESIELVHDDKLDRTHTAGGGLIELITHRRVDRPHAPCHAARSISALFQPFDQSRSDDITAVRSTWCKPT